MSDIDTVVMDSLKALDPNRPIREADIGGLSATSDQVLLRSKVELIPRRGNSGPNAGFVPGAALRSRYADTAKQGTARFND